MIEKNIPIPPAVPGLGYTEALRELSRAEVGSSIFLETSSSTATVTARRVGGSGWVTVRKEGSGTRIWKTAEPKGGVR